MKVSRAQVAENRKRILAAASRLFRESGISGVNVAQIMDAVGLTHGAFYGYFDSKDALVAEAVSEVIATSTKVSEVGRSEYLKTYLSTHHRDHRGSGCPVAALASEAVHESKPVREVFTRGLQEQLDQLARTGGGREDQRRRTAITDWSAMVGALILSRLVTDEELSTEILDAARDALTPDA
jgi:TetR/AcrR family transcriptional regulator, transcriptional repressor for nem operon